MCASLRGPDGAWELGHAGQRKVGAINGRILAQTWCTAAITGKLRLRIDNVLTFWKLVQGGDESTTTD